MPYHETPAWKRYLELREQRPSAFRNGVLDIVTDPARIDAYVEKTGKKLGVLYESPYHLLVVDLVRQAQAEPASGDADCFAYERLLPAVETGAIVAIPMIRDSFVLLRQYRHAPRESMLAFPRGFGEEGIPAEDNLRKELREELGTAEISNVRRLGAIAADSGILGTKAEVFLCDLEHPVLKQGYEEIEEIRLLSENELKERIGRGEISDGYTLAAFALYLSKEG